MVANISEVSAMTAEIETDKRGVPVLLRDYLTLGVRLAGINVAPNFGHAITALVVVDLRATNQRLLSRYMGKAGAAAFLAWHNQPPQASGASIENRVRSV